MAESKIAKLGTEIFYLLPTGSAAGSSAGIVFTHGRFLGFSPRMGDTLH